MLLKLAKHLGQFRYDPAKGRFRDWLLTVARNAWSECPGTPEAGRLG